MHIQKISHKCKICEYEWKAKPHNILNGTGCPVCGFQEQLKKQTKSHEEYVKEVKNKNPSIEVIGQYINAKTPIMHRCITHDVCWKTTPSRILIGNGCQQCRINKFKESNTKIQSEYIDEVKLINPNIEVIGQYINAKTKVLHKCLIHDIVWEASPSNILKGCGCKECGNEKIGNKNSGTHEEYVKKLLCMNPDVIVLEQYDGANTKIMHKCKICGHQWEAQPANLLSGKGCPKCCESHGEKNVGYYLNQHNVCYIPQYCFDNCKGQKVLPFDFYIPELNICIEYQGEQHYRPVNFGGINDDKANNNFLTTQLHDEIKKNYCENNGIKLICIPYWENINEYLNKNLLI